jgi:hypothetical protein
MTRAEAQLWRLHVSAGLKAPLPRTTSPGLSPEAQLQRRPASRPLPAADRPKGLKNLIVTKEILH